MPPGALASRGDQPPPIGRSGTTEAGGDAVLGRLVAGPGAGGKPGDAGQRLLEGGAATLPVGPELEEAGLGDAGPVGPERGHVAGELSQSALDGGRPGVELGGDLLELLGGDADAGGRHIAPPGVRWWWSSSTFGRKRPQMTVHSPRGGLSRRSPRPTSGRRSAGAGRRRPGRWSPGDGPGGGGRPGPTSARRPARGRPRR